MVAPGPWDYLYHNVCHSEEGCMWSICLGLWPIFVFVTTTALFTYVDLTGRPAWVIRYKVQGSHKELDRRRLVHVLKVVCFNILGVGVLLSAIQFPIALWMGCTSKPEVFPSVPRVLLDLAGCAILDEIGFYYTHRLAHWGPLYRAIHKKHHEWTAPIGLVAAYAHPAEHVVCNLLPFTCGYILLSTHLFTACIWYTIASISTIVHHSGYHLPLLPSPEFHDFHHLRFTCNYGVLGVLDWLHGTDTTFRKARQSERHKTLIGLTPMKMLYPEKMD